MKTIIPELLRMPDTKERELASKIEKTCNADIICYEFEHNNSSNPTATILIKYKIMGPDEDSLAENIRNFVDETLPMVTGHRPLQK